MALCGGLQLTAAGPRRHRTDFPINLECLTVILSSSGYVSRTTRTEHTNRRHALSLTHELADKLQLSNDALGRLRQTLVVNGCYHAVKTNSKLRLILSF